MGVFSRQNIVTGLMLIVVFSLFDVTNGLVGPLSWDQLIMGRLGTWFVGLIIAWIILRKWRGVG